MGCCGGGGNTPQAQRPGQTALQQLAARPPANASRQETAKTFQSATLRPAPNSGGRQQA